MYEPSLRDRNVQHKRRKICATIGSWAGNAKLLALNSHVPILLFLNAQDNNPAVMRCILGKLSYYSERIPHSADGNLSARVRAITPAGNGSWSRTALFSLQRFEPEDATSKCVNLFSGF